MSFSDSSFVHPSVVKLTRDIVWTWKNVMFICGGIAAVALNILTFPSFMNGMNSTHNKMFSVIFWLIAFISAAMLTAFWEKISDASTNWRKPIYMAAFAGSILIIIMSLALNIGFATQMVNEMLHQDLPKHVFVPPKEQRTGLWYVMVTFISLVDLLGEPFALFMFGKIISNGEAVPAFPAPVRTSLFDQETH